MTLDSAERASLIVKKRQGEYGHPFDTHSRIAELWSGYLGVPIIPEDVALMMVLFKMGREEVSHKEDNLVDMVGYVLAYEQILERRKEIAAIGTTEGT